MYLSLEFVHCFFSPTKFILLCMFAMWKVLICLVIHRCISCLNVILKHFIYRFFLELFKTMLPFFLISTQKPLSIFVLFVS